MRSLSFFFFFGKHSTITHTHTQHKICFWQRDWREGGGGLLGCICSCSVRREGRRVPQQRGARDHHRVREERRRSALVGDGQVSLGQTVLKGNAPDATPGRRVKSWRALRSTSDALALMERLEMKLEQYPDQLSRACIELSKLWRTDKYLRRPALC